MIKPFILATLLLIITIPFNARSQGKKGFEISGHVDGVEDGEKVILLHYPFTWFPWSPFAPIPIDSCIVKNGEFRLRSASMDDGPHFYHLKFQWPKHNLHAFADSGAAMICQLLIADGDHITIHGGNIDKLPEKDISHYVGIDGSPSAMAYIALASSEMAFTFSIRTMERALRNVREILGYDRAAVGAYIDSRNNLINSVLDRFLKAPDGNWQPAVPVFMVDMVADLNHAPIVMDVYNSLDESQKNSYYGKRLKGYADLAVGQFFPPFTLPDTEGKPTALKDILKSSKLTLVHIWGSQSAERERLQGELRLHYKKYHDKGLNVIGVSADTVGYVFKGFVNEQKYPWVNVSDLQGWDNHGSKKSIIEDVFLEGGHGVPNTTNVLLDNTGKIIAWDVYDVELQWYLEKYLGE